MTCNQRSDFSSKKSETVLEANSVSVQEKLTKSRTSAKLGMNLTPVY